MEDHHNYLLIVSIVAIIAIISIIIMLLTVLNGKYTLGNAIAPAQITSLDTVQPSQEAVIHQYSCTISGKTHLGQCRTNDGKTFDETKDPLCSQIETFCAHFSGTFYLK